MGGWREGEWEGRKGVPSGEREEEEEREGREKKEER